MVIKALESIELTEITELITLLQIPDSGRGLLPVLSVVTGLLTQHPILVSKLKVTEEQLAFAMSVLQQTTSDKDDLLRLTKQSERPVYALLVEAAFSLPSLPASAWCMLL